MKVSVFFKNKNERKNYIFFSLPRIQLLIFQFQFSQENNNVTFTVGFCCCCYFLPKVISNIIYYFFLYFDGEKQHQQQHQQLW